MSNPDKIGQARSDAALGKLGIPGGEEGGVGKRVTTRMGGQIRAVQHFKTSRLEGAGRAIGQVAATIGSVIATPILAASYLPARLFGGSRGGEAVKETGKKMWKATKEITKKEDYKKLGQVALMGIGVAATAGLALGVKSARERIVAAHGQVATEATFQEMRSYAKNERHAAQISGYDKTDAKSVARFMNRMKDEGRTFTENGKLMYVDEKNGRFLMAEMNADGRAVVKTTHCMEVTRKSYSKDEKVPVKELYRYAKAFALAYDDIQEKCAGQIDKMTVSQLMQSANKYLQKLDRKVENLYSRRTLIKYLFSSEIKTDEFKRILNYLRRVPLEFAKEGVEPHLNDRTTEERLKTAVSNNEKLGAFNEYLTRHKVEADPDKIKEHLEAQDFRYAQVMDHIQCRVLEETGIEYTQLGKENDSQCYSVISALDIKLGALANTLYPNGPQELEMMRELAQGNKPEAYIKQEELTSADKINEHLEELCQRYQVKDKNALVALLNKKIKESLDIFKFAGKRNLRAQKGLLQARSGEELGKADRTIITEYLKREGIVAEDYQGAIQNFKLGQEPAINEARLQAHINTLLNRYGVGEDNRSTLQMQKDFINCVTSANDLNGLKRSFVAKLQSEPRFKDYCQYYEVLATDHSGEIKEEHIDIAKLDVQFQKILRLHNQESISLQTNWDTATSRAVEADTACEQKLQAIGQGNPEERLRNVVNELIDQKNFIKGAVTAKQAAKEKVSDLQKMRAIWTIVHGSKTADDYSETERASMTTFLKSRGLKISEGSKEWDKDINWRESATDDEEIDFREELNEILNRTLEEEADVVNTGGDNADQHVRKTIGEKISEQLEIAKGKKGGYSLQVERHKQALKEASPEQITMVASSGKIKVTKRITFDKNGKPVEDDYEQTIEFTMKSDTKKSIQELWTDVNEKRDLIPKQPAPEARKKRSKR